MNSKRRLVTLTIAGSAAILVLSLLKMRFSLGVVSGDSMLPTMQTGDLMLIDRKAYELKEPKREDIIITAALKSSIVKRIVGLPGERLELKRGALYINGSPIVENHAVRTGLLEVQPGTLFPGKFATLGDNRDMPDVLAVHPIVSKDQIFGKVVFIMRL